MDKLIEGMPSVTQSQNITVDKLKEYLPKGTSIRVSERIVDTINNIETTTGISQEYAEERLMSSMHLLRKQGSSIEKLVNAVKFCCLKRHMKNKEAWAIVFPDRHKKLVDEKRYIDSHVSEYNNSDMVVEVEKLMLVPAYVTYQPYYHQAIQKQYDLMNGVGANEDDRVSPHVQHLAAKELAELTKMPEDNSVELKIGMSDEAKSVQTGLAEQLAKMADAQMAMLKAGADISKVQKIGIDTDTIIEAEVD